ncbi:MAG TPA: TIGR01777 family oxidoreductase [Bryobacteraceae bacterium]|jgi:hypothetical protein|nr:TIGR01777 family oxidoreductase [Bryobacteraceae bacterium]
MTVRRLRIVIPGGTGQLGLILARHFHEQGHSVTVIGRHPKSAEWPTLQWTGHEPGPWAKSIDGADVVINLAGRSVDCRYSTTHRREILNSRTISTGVVGQAIAASARPPRLWLNASTATIYRHSFDKPIDEQGEIGGGEPDVPREWGFSAEVAVAWENAFFAAATSATRRVAMRTAIVMSPDDGGAFDKLLRLVRFGLGGPVASGKQYVSWIHEADFIRAVEFLIDKDDFEGPVNICSPCPIWNQRFMRCLRQAWCTTYIGMPIPAWVLSIGAFLLRTESELVLKSRYVIPARLLNAGFDFHFPDWRGAAQDLVQRWREAREELGS